VVAYSLKRYKNYLVKLENRVIGRAAQQGLQSLRT
jgi:hypothetical protein